MPDLRHFLGLRQGGALQGGVNRKRPNSGIVPQYRDHVARRPRVKHRAVLAHRFIKILRLDGLRIGRVGTTRDTQRQQGGKHGTNIRSCQISPPFTPAIRAALFW